MIKLYKELVEKIYRKEIHDQKTVCALLLARPFLELL